MRAAVLSWALKISEENAVNALTWVDAVSSNAEWMRAAESPLERLFLAAMSMDPGFTQDETGVWFDGFEVRIQENALPAARVDIALHRGPHRVYVELDGHDFHERTKEQASRDRSRDRSLTGPYSMVLRFTGSEVYADPCGCIAELAGKLEAIRCDEDSTSAHIQSHIEAQVSFALREATKAHNSRLSRNYDLVAFFARKCGRFDAAQLASETAERYMPRQLLAGEYT